MALQNAELAAGADPLLLTNNITFDDDGNPVANGWGPNTFSTPEQKAAATALIRKIAALLPDSVRNNSNTGPYTATDVNVTNGLLVLGSSNDSLISHTGNIATSGTALTEYQNAAIADFVLGAAGPGGLVDRRARPREARAVRLALGGRSVQRDWSGRQRRVGGAAVPPRGAPEGVLVEARKH